MYLHLVEFNKRLLKIKSKTITLPLYKINYRKHYQALKTSLKTN